MAVSAGGSEGAPVPHGELNDQTHPGDRRAARAAPCYERRRPVGQTGRDVSRAKRRDASSHLDSGNVGPEVSLGELTFPPNGDSGEHTHGSIEIFYVLSGELEHVVNGKSQILTPGMVGYVKPPDKIRHKTGPAGAKVVVMWVPGAEAGKIIARWTKEP